MRSKTGGREHGLTLEQSETRMKSKTGKPEEQIDVEAAEGM
ncbi:MAG: hypothetical protein ACLRMX_01915 [Lachnospira eligens]